VLSTTQEAVIVIVGWGVGGKNIEGPEVFDFNTSICRSKVWSVIRKN